MLVFSSTKDVASMICTTRSLKFINILENVTYFREAVHASNCVYVFIKVTATYVLSACLSEYLDSGNSNYDMSISFREGIIFIFV